MAKHYPVRFLPFEDELITSWLIRLAWANGQNSQRFMYELTSTRRMQVWNTDLDWCGHGDLFIGLEKKLGITENYVHKNTLKYQLSLISNQMSDKNNCNRHWVVSSKRHKYTETKSGLVVCLLCLREDPTPYLRHWWRLSWYTVCIRHKIQLLEKCPRCNTHFDFQYYDRLKTHNAALFLGHIAHCSHCGFDLLLETEGALCKATFELTKFTEYMVTSYNRGWFRLGQKKHQYTFALFEVIGCLLQLIQGNRYLKPITDHLSNKWDISGEFESRPERFDYLDIASRRGLLIFVYYLLKRYPLSILLLSKKYGITSSYWFHYKQDMPFFFHKPIKQFLDHSWYKPSDEETWNVRQFLIKNNYPVHFYNIRRWLGRYYPKTRSMKDAKLADGYDF